MTQTKKTYHPDEMLTLEVVTNCHRLTVGRHVIQQGTNRLDILGSELALFQNALEPHADDVLKLKGQWEAKVKAIRDEAEDPLQADKVITDMAFSSNWMHRFEALYDREPKPLLKVEVLESKGIKPTQKNKLDRAQETNERTLEAILKLAEALTQNTQKSGTAKKN